MSRALLILIVGLLILACLPGCGMLSRQKQKTETDTKVDSSAKVTTVIREKVDTSVKVPGSTSKATKPVKDILAGDSLHIDQPDLDVKVKFDPESGKLTAVGTVKPREIPVTIDREIRKEEETQVKREERSKQVDIKPAPLIAAPGWWVFALLLVILLAYLLRKYLI